MSPPRLFLFDDRRARRWAPFTLTRPAGELLFGCFTLRERAELAFGVPCAGHLSRAALAGFDDPDAPPVLGVADVGTHDTRVFLSSRAVPDLESGSTPLDGDPPGQVLHGRGPRPTIPEGGRPAPILHDRRPLSTVPGAPGLLTMLPDVPALLTMAGEIVGCIVPEGAAAPSQEWLRNPVAEALDGNPVELPGILLGWPWDLVARNADRVARDVAAFWPEGTEAEGLVRIGPGSLSLAADARIEPGVHVDTRSGPVRLAEGATVEGPARLVGPLFVGAGSSVLGGTVGTSSVGPKCKVRGEVSECVFTGFANKAHDGYVGHALVGRWVNLGALTTNSDLKNNYSPVKVWTLDGEVDTGALKVGCFLGDHVKTGIGTVLNTGTVVGAGSNVFGGGMPPSVVPPFSWGSGTDLRDHQLDKFLETAEAAMARRDRALTPGARRILERAWRDTAGRRT